VSDHWASDPGIDSIGGHDWSLPGSTPGQWRAGTGDMEALERAGCFHWAHGLVPWTRLRPSASWWAARARSKTCRWSATRSVRRTSSGRWGGRLFDALVDRAMEDPSLARVEDREYAARQVAVQLVYEGRDWLLRSV
jgi:hypothetical protein